MSSVFSHEAHLAYTPPFLYLYPAISISDNIRKLTILNSLKIKKKSFQILKGELSL